ncbi:hypothetical protein NYR97_11555 [Xanthomonas hydrangeae]|uniref:Uncharacterized protein n=1 Tax=Xanthomonas hydrangeae TaxID=2775159 RepID=A0AAU0B6V8_9XANT|nr:hypothetical protein [Xanthomonas hydrangeae]WOB47929.1 hypothetical protein NYR97_11555 [Xanthomonas hydrangeae]
MTDLHVWRQRLVRSPYPEPAEADAVLLPYRSLSDYQAVDGFARSLLPAPVLVGYFQYYRLLIDVIAQLRQHLDIDAPVLVEISRPLGVALPRGLLEEGVLVTDDTAPQAVWWARQGALRTVQIRSRIRRDLHEFGDNSLTVLLQSTVDTHDPLPAILGGTSFASAFIEEKNAILSRLSPAAIDALECA